MKANDDLTPLMYSLRYNKRENLNLNEKQMNYLIKNSNLKIQDKYGDTALMYAFIYNKNENLNLNKEQINYLIKNSDLKIQDRDGLIPLMHGLFYNKNHNLNLNEEQFKTMFDALNEKQKQTTFQKLIHENNNNNHQYLEEINLLLYNCEFQPNKKFLNWLQRNKYQDIIQMIEKRDVFFQLNQDFKKIDNLKKDNKIKI